LGVGKENGGWTGKKTKDSNGAVHIREGPWLTKGEEGLGEDGFFRGGRAKEKKNLEGA